MGPHHPVGADAEEAELVGLAWEVPEVSCAGGWVFVAVAEGFTTTVDGLQVPIPMLSPQIPTMAELESRRIIPPGLKTADASARRGKVQRKTSVKTFIVKSSFESKVHLELQIFQVCHRPALFKNVHGLIVFSSRPIFSGFMSQGSNSRMT